jgi:RNA polymerase sigma-70 factor (ECF subfamily)
MARWAQPEIVFAALAGNEAAVEELVAAVWPGCFRLAASVIGDRSLAQDAAQEACVIVPRKVRSVRNADAFDTWLYRIVMRESARVRRRREREGQASFARSFGGDDSASIDVWRALAMLSPELRDVTVLFYIDDLKSETIASVLGIPHSTVRTRLARARERLRGLLDDYRDEPLSTTLEVNHHVV